MKRAAIFDLDGTLIDSLGDIAALMNETLQAAKLPTHPLDAYRQFVGSGVRALAERATAERDADIDALVADFGERYRAEPIRNTCAFDGIDALLDELARREVVVAVLSNKPHDLTEVIAAELFPDRFREVWGHKSDFPRKPDPKSAFAVAQRISVSPTACIFVGDTDVDMLTGVNAGMTPVGVSWGFRPRDELTASGAAVVAEHPRDILRAFDADTPVTTSSSAEP